MYTTHRTGGSVIHTCTNTLEVKGMGEGLAFTRTNSERSAAAQRTHRRLQRKLPSTVTKSEAYCARAIAMLHA